MKQKLVYLLKHYRFLQYLYRTIGSFILRFVGLFVKTDKRLVVFLSLMGTKYNDSPKSIYEYMINHKQYKKYKMIWAFENPEEFPNIPSVKIDTPRFFITALKAGYWVSSTQFERGLTYKKKNTKYLYTMHGTAIKLSGNDCPGRKDFNFKTVDYLCVQSDFDKYVFKKSFKATNCCFLESGRPCNDSLWNASQNQCEKIKIKLGLPLNKKIILYAPTWRDSINGGKTYDIKPPIDINVWKEKLGDEYIVLFRAHHITTRIMDICFNDFFRNYSDYPEINDLYMVSDILVTDYSSVMVDYAILERPIFCFAYDYENYLKERGTYFELDDELPNKSCRTQEQLLSNIVNIDYEDQRERSRRFKAKYDKYGGNGVELTVRKVFGK